MELSKALQCRWLRERGSEDQHKGKLLGPKDMYHRNIFAHPAIRALSQHINANKL